MAKEGIVLGHRVSSNDLEVDRAKIATIENLTTPVTSKVFRDLGYAGFSRGFIKDFSKTIKPLSSLLENDISFAFTDELNEAFKTIKERLITAPVMALPDWESLFEIKYDASE